MADTKGQLTDLVARVAIGAVAGAAATLAFAATLRRLQPDGEDATPQLATIAGAAAFGALLAGANPRLGRVGGALAGGGLWLAGEIGLLPALAIRPATGPSPRGATMLAAHVAWGWSAAEIMRDAQTVRETLFSDD